MQTATITVRAGDFALQIQKMNPLTVPCQRIGPMIHVPPHTELTLQVFASQGLAMMEHPQ